MSHDDQPLVDLGALFGRLRAVGAALAGIALVGVVADGLTHGLSFAILVRWLVGYLLALVLAAAVIVGGQAVSGASRAQRRGERLSREDVGLVPPRRGAEGRRRK